LERSSVDQGRASPVRLSSFIALDPHAENGGSLGRNVRSGGGSRGTERRARDRKTGALTQLPGTDACISEGGTGGDCVDGVALEGAQRVAVSHDGKNVYIASFSSDAVAVFARDRNGPSVAVAR
jgi:hypothetical protein